MDLTSYDGQDVPRFYDKGFIALSFVFSVIGCWAAFELLQRRTSTRGLNNWLLLLGTAASMGAVGMWCMHTIGNRAISMRSGEKPMHIVYAARYTAASYLLPIGVIGLAFYRFNVSEIICLIEIGIAGVMTSLAMCAMHYVGQAGVSNYVASYSGGHVFGSVAIALALSTAALKLFFHLKTKWTTSYFRRLACALILAIAISSMHWIAILGTSYRFKANSTTNKADFSRDAAVIATLILSVGCSGFLLAVFTLEGYLTRKAATRASQALLASVIFDPDDNIMLTADGLLPCKKITKNIDQCFERVFDVGHPVFGWMVRASYCWYKAEEVVPNIRAHLRATSVIKSFRPESNSNFKDMMSFDRSSIEDYSFLLKELFLIAAHELAHTLQEPFTNLGRLFGGILDIGTVRKAAPRRFFPIRRASEDLGDSQTTQEIGNSTQFFGRGILLAVIRRADQKEAVKLRAAGFRFAPIAKIENRLAHSMEIPQTEMTQYLELIRQDSKKSSMLEPGVHLGCHILKPEPSGGFNVLVRRDAKNVLPTVKLPIYQLEDWQIEFLSRMDNCTLSNCHNRLNGRRISTSEKERIFGDQLLEAFSKLIQTVENPFLQEARLIAVPLYAPCSSSLLEESDNLEHAQIIVFQTVVEMGRPNYVNQRCEFSSSSLFRCQQQVYKGSPGHEKFARKLQEDFSSPQRTVSSSERLSNYSAPLKWLCLILSFPLRFSRPIPSSLIAKNKGVQRATSKRGYSPTTSRNVGSSTRLGKVSEPDQRSKNVDQALASAGSDVEMSNLRALRGLDVMPLDDQTFADKLMKLTFESCQKQRSTTLMRLSPQGSSWY